VARLEAESLAPNGAESRRAEATLAQARGALAAAEARLGYTRIHAPGKGVILTRDVEPGDAVQAGQVLMEMSLDAPTQLASEPTEKNLAVLAPGQKALASADAFPGERFTARVIYVSPSVDAERGTVEVRLAVDDPPPYLRPELTVSVEIEVARREGVLAVPVDGVRDPTSSTPWVMTLRDGRVERQDVRLGAQGESWVEVIEGLVEGDWVVPSTAAGIVLGQRARPEAVSIRPGS
jgi:HlyD family secretion protein